MLEPEGYLLDVVFGESFQDDGIFSVDIISGSKLRPIIITPDKYSIHLINDIDKPTPQFNMFNMCIFKAAFHLWAIMAGLKERGVLVDEFDEAGDRLIMFNKPIGTSCTQ